MSTSYDAIIVGGGHNGLVAAAYLARAGRRVLVLEARPVFGGAVASAEVFAGVPARLSRFSYLVSLLPEQLCRDLGLRLELRSRRVASYSPYVRGAHPSGLLVERPLGPSTQTSFRELTGSTDAFDQWLTFEADLTRVAEVVAPTLTEPLPHAADLAESIGPELWSALVEQPINGLIDSRFADDLIRGVVTTDALIGTFARADDASLIQNRCFLYHVIGNGTGEWKVPVGGMGAVAAALEAAARGFGADLRTGARVASVTPTGRGAVVRLVDGQEFEAPYVLAGCAPHVLATLLTAGGGSDPGPGSDPGETRAHAEPAGGGARAVFAEGGPEGSQLKVNLVLRRLPRLASGLDPRTAFAGTLHLGQGAQRLTEAYEIARAGRIPDPLPAEVYCHTLTDDSILSPELSASGAHTLTLFGLHTPARLFADDPDAARTAALAAALHSLQEVLAEPVEDCLAVDATGRPCVEVMTPLDVERELGMPGGHIFHGDLQWPWLNDESAGAGRRLSAAERWGVQTRDPGILVCGSGARRGGAVSGLGGHNAAMAVLDSSA